MARRVHTIDDGRDCLEDSRTDSGIIEGDQHARRVAVAGKAPTLLSRQPACSRRTLLATLASAPLLAACAAAKPNPRTPVASRPLIYVALGASDAVGVGAAGPTESWVADLARKLPAGSRLIDLGVSGETLHRALTDELPIALDSHPDLVTIWLVVNDFNARVALPQYAADLETMLTALQKQTHAHVVIANVPDLALLPAYAGIQRAALSAEVDRWNAVIARQAAAHGAILVDLLSTWKELANHPNYVGSDGFHPSAAGYARLADIFYAVIAAHHLT